jgi:hypothetical protein
VGLIVRPMFESLKSAFNSVKEGALEAGAKSYINQKIQKFGSVTSLEINSRQRTIGIEAALKGEGSPIQVKVGSYEVIQDGDASYIILRGFEASREWIAAVLNEYVAGQRFPIPSGLNKVL